MASIRNYMLLGATLFLRTQQTNQLVCKRGARVQRWIFREKLPMYKNNLQNLPVLTSLLTSREKPTDLQNAIEVRQKKLEIYRSYMPLDPNTNLIDALFHPENGIDRLLTIIDKNLVTMTSFYIAVSFEVIDDMMQANLCDKSTIAVSPEFKRLCIRALNKIRFFEADEVIKLIKCLSTLGVSESTLIVQSALQMARHLINDMNLDELNILLDSLNTFKIEQAAEKSLLVALKAAIPLAQKRTKCLTEPATDSNSPYKSEMWKESARATRRSRR